MCGVAPICLYTSLYRRDFSAGMKCLNDQWLPQKAGICADALNLKFLLGLLAAVHRKHAGYSWHIYQST